MRGTEEPAGLVGRCPGRLFKEVGGGRLAGTVGLKLSSRRCGSCAAVGSVEDEHLDHHVWVEHDLRLVVDDFASGRFVDGFVKRSVISF